MPCYNELSITTNENLWKIRWVMESLSFRQIWFLPNMLTSHPKCQDWTYCLFLHIWSRVYLWQMAAMLSRCISSLVWYIALHFLLSQILFPASQLWHISFYSLSNLMSWEKLGKNCSRISDFCPLWHMCIVRMSNIVEVRNA